MPLLDGWTDRHVGRNSDVDIQLNSVLMDLDEGQHSCKYLINNKFCMPDLIIQQVVLP